MSEFATDVATEAESSPASQPADTSQATSQPEQQNGGQSVPYERFQQVNGRMREFERIAQSLQQELQTLRQEREAAGRTQPSDEERQKQAEKTEAIKALNELIQETDYGKGLQEQRQQSFAARGDQMIAAFARDNGLDLQELSDDITDAIRKDPMLMQRAQRGDLSIIPLLLRTANVAARGFKAQSAQAQRQQVGAVGKSKSALSTLPPRPTGSVPGGVALPKPVAGDTASQRGAIRARHDRMRSMVDELPE